MTNKTLRQRDKRNNINSMTTSTHMDTTRRVIEKPKILTNQPTLSNLSSMSRILIDKQAIPTLTIVIFRTFTKTHKKVETKTKLGKSTLKINTEKTFMRIARQQLKDIEDSTL
jgi:hypothetical protein